MAITRDKYIIQDYGNNNDVMGDEVRQNWRYYETKRDFSELDSIQCTSNDVMRLSDVVFDMKESSSELIENPSLREFELVINDRVAPKMKDEITVARFLKTILKKNEKSEVYGKKVTYYPYLDAFLSFRNPDIVDAIMTICTIYADGEDKEFGTSQRIIWVRKDMERTFNENYQEIIELCRNLKIAYLSIQKGMRDKPTVFTTASEHPAHIYGKSSGTNSKRNHAKVIRTICINRDELEKQQHGHHEITCPCWGVVGHWRTYKKTGKRVWVAPYRKGKQRDNPDAYHPKDYEFVGGAT